MQNVNAAAAAGKVKLFALRY